MPWDPSQYLKFAGHRLRPAVDLLNRIDVAKPAEEPAWGGWSEPRRLLIQDCN